MAAGISSSAREHRRVKTKIETRALWVWLDPGGIMFSRAKPLSDLDLADAREIIAAVGSLGQGRRRPLLADLRNVRSLSREGRAYFAGAETAKVESACALLVSSPLSRALGSFIVRLMNPLIPVRLFTSEDAALVWLKGFLEAP